MTQTSGKRLRREARDNPVLKWRRWRDRKRLKQLRHEYPDEPWQWDHSWNPKQIEDETLLTFWRYLAQSLIFSAFVLPMNFFVFIRSPEFSWPPRLIVGFFDLLLLAVLGITAILGLRHRIYGKSILRFSRFPFRVGNSVEVELHARARFHESRKLTATLRCIQEKQLRRGHSRRSTQFACYELFKQEKTLEGTELRLTEVSPLKLDFTTPAELGPTRLSEIPPRYWELEVRADMPGIDYAARFLVPIY